MPTRRLACLRPLLVLLGVLAACSESTDPGDVPGGGTSTGRVDPGAGEVVLQSIDVPLADGGRTRLELIGANLVLDDADHVTIDVALRNAGRFELHAPTLLWLERFEPSGVAPADADTVPPTMGPLPAAYGFFYDDEFGDDRVLAPGETSAARSWTFHVPGQGSFSFGTRIEPGDAPPYPAISGFTFYDQDRDGVRDRGERPLYPGVIQVVAPDSSRVLLQVDQRGHYVYELLGAGLHQLTFLPGFETFVALEYTTPNPRHVLITPDADGGLVGYHAAHFGAVTALPPPRRVIRFTDAPPDSLHEVDWRLLDVAITGPNNLTYGVGFSGCDPRHDWTLFMSGGVMESLPPQVDLVLVHHTAELCDAAFTTRESFRLDPLRELILRSGPYDTVQLNILDFEGNRTPLLWRLEEDGGP